MQLTILDPAQKELDDAVAYFRSGQPGLEQDFLSDFQATVQRIQNFPMAWHPYSKRTRRCLFSTFPYGILYQIRDNEILIVALTHQSQNPERWNDRI